MNFISSDTLTAKFLWEEIMMLTFLKWCDWYIEGNQNQFTTVQFLSLIATGNSSSYINLKDLRIPNSQWL
jgi:hypothetical protein